MARHKRAAYKNRAQHRPSQRKTRQYNGAAEDQVIHETAAAMRGVEALGKETAAFIGRRAGHTAETLERYRECRNVAEMFAVQQDWLRRAAQDYIQTGFRLAHAMTGAASENAARMERIIDAEAVDITARTHASA